MGATASPGRGRTTDRCGTGRSAILEKRLVEMTSQKADAVEALERETAATRAQADRAAAAELASVAVQAASALRRWFAFIAALAVLRRRCFILVFI